MSPPSLIASPRGRLEGLVAAAMIGADRAGKTASEKILTEAAAMGVRARAGYRAAAGVGPLPPCPPETLPAAPQRAVATLQRLLNPPDPFLIAEWAELALARRMRAPESLVPSLLSWWCAHPQRPPSV